MSDNVLKGEEIAKLSQYKNLFSLVLAGNPIKEFSELEAIKELEIEQLDLFNCPVTNKEGYREKIYSLFKNLKV